MAISIEMKVKVPTWCSYVICNVEDVTALHVSGIYAHRAVTSSTIDLV
jgi:hypothetical protein